MENLGLKQLLNDEYFTPLSRIAITIIDFKKVLNNTLDLGNLLTSDEMQLLYKWHFDVNGLISKGLCKSYSNLSVDVRN